MELTNQLKNMSDMLSNGDMHDAFADIFGGGNLMDPNDMDDDEQEEKIPIKDKKEFSLTVRCLKTLFVYL